MLEDWLLEENNLEPIEGGQMYSPNPLVLLSPNVYTILGVLAFVVEYN